MPFGRFSVISCLDHYAISPRGFVPLGGRVVLRVLAYQPKSPEAPEGLRVSIQACEPSGTPIAEDPLITKDGSLESEVQAMVRTSEADGWTFFPVLTRESHSRVSS